MDRLIRELIAAPREASPPEILQIVQRLASAPFDPRSDAIVPQKDRALSYQGRTLGSRTPAIIYHLAKRIVGDREWAPGTTAERFVADLHDAVRSPSARIVLYRRRGGSVAAVIAPNHIPRARLGADARPYVFVVFAADRGTIITGYQTSFAVPPNVPEDALWLT